VIFLDGDRHHTVLSKMQESNYVYPLYDLTCSPLTSGFNQSKERLNAYKIEETIVGQHNFGILNVSGAKNDRVLRISIFDKDGNELWIKEINAKDLRYQSK